LAFVDKNFNISVRPNKLTNPTSFIDVIDVFSLRELIRGLIA
jgi:hypothetical protein